MYFFTHASKNVHVDIKTHSGVNSNDNRIPFGPKMLRKAKEVTVKRLELKHAGRIHRVSL